MKHLLVFLFLSPSYLISQSFVLTHFERGQDQTNWHNLGRARVMMNNFLYHLEEASCSPMLGLPETSVPEAEKLLEWACLYRNHQESQLNGEKKWFYLTHKSLNLRSPYSYLHHTYYELGENDSLFAYLEVQFMVLDNRVQRVYVTELPSPRVDPATLRALKLEWDQLPKIDFGDIPPPPPMPGQEEEDQRHAAAVKAVRCPGEKD